MYFCKLLRVNVRVNLVAMRESLAEIRSPRRISSMRLPWLQALTERRVRARSRLQIAGVDIGADPVTRKPRRRAPLISIEPATFFGKLHIRFGLAPSITESVRPSIV